MPEPRRAVHAARVCAVLFMLANAASHAADETPSVKRARLVADLKTVTLYQEGRETAKFTLPIRNVSADAPAEGVYLRLVEVTAPRGANFDPQRNLKLSWRGQSADDLWRSPANGASRSIAASEQAEISGETAGLRAGEYTVKVGVGAANLAADADPVTLKIFVKHRSGWPLAVLLFGILISYLATKGLESQRRRAAQLKKIADIRPSWLRQEATLPAVAALAILKQAEDRNRGALGALFGQEATAARTEKAELLIRILGRVRRLRRAMAAAAWDPMIERRTNKRLDSLLDGLDADTIDEDRARQFEVELAALEQWLDPKQRDALYGASLKGDVDALMARATPDTFRQHGDVVEQLRARITQALAQQPAGGALPKLEADYAKLKILWERCQDEDQSVLVALGNLLKANLDQPIDTFFAAADALAWEKLRVSPLEFTSPDVNHIEPPEAYQLIRFEVAPLNRRLGNNYLFKHRLQCQWTLHLEPQRPWWRAHASVERQPLSQPVTREPRLIQYVPRRGKVTVNVSITYLGQPGEKIAVIGPLPIQRSSDYGVLSAFRFNDAAAVLLAGLFAGISGMATFYVSNAAFGTIGDYIALFIWGAGIDQTKNFIQNLSK
jgi:hypothetical protein